MDSSRRTHPACVTLALAPFLASNVTTADGQFGGFGAAAETDDVGAGGTWWGD